MVKLTVVNGVDVCILCQKIWVWLILQCSLCSENTVIHFQPQIDICLVYVHLWASLSFLPSYTVFHPCVVCRKCSQYAPSDKIKGPEKPSNPRPGVTFHPATIVSLVTEPELVQAQLSKDDILLHFIQVGGVLWKLFALPIVCCYCCCLCRLGLNYCICNRQYDIKAPVIVFIALVVCPGKLSYNLTNTYKINDKSYIPIFLYIRTSLVLYYSLRCDYACFLLAHALMMMMSDFSIRYALLWVERCSMYQEESSLIRKFPMHRGCPVMTGYILQQ